MSSLVPGPIFIASGLNRNSTPTPPDITPAQLDEKYRRIDFNGQAWPRDSPISRMYDVANTSTKMIILNNKYGKNSTRLRGYYTGPKRPERHIDPNRHRSQSPRNPRFHEECYNSSSPKFEPTVKTDLEWINSSQRPPNALIARTSVNPKRHATCQATSELPVYDERSRSRMSLPPNKYFTNSEYADMSMGEKIYMWSIEKIYSMNRMKQLKQEQYKKLLEMEAKKGYHGYQEYNKYMRYINSAKDRSYGTGSPSDKMSRSAYSPRSQKSRSATSRSSRTKSETRSEEDLENDKQDQPERPKTSLGHSRQEPLNDTKPSDSETKKRTASAGSAGRKSIGSQRSQPKSPSPSRKKSAKSSASGSQRSLRSKSGSRASSAVSAKGADKTEKDYSDSSLTTSEDDVTQLHKEGRDRPKSRLGHPGIEDKDQAKAEGEGTHIHQEGKDRPKSRLGHPGADDRDQDSIYSSTLSIKSDNASLSSDSGVENGKKEKKTKQSSDTSSLSSVENSNRRRNNQDKKNKNKHLEQSSETKQNKRMGSRSSVNSKSSSRNENVNARSGNQSKVGKRNEELAYKGKPEQEVKTESPDTKVHRIPSGTLMDKEARNDEKIDEERDLKVDQDKGDPELEIAEKSTSDNVGNQEEDNQVQSDDNKKDSIAETELAKQKSEDTTNEVENKTEEEPNKMEIKSEEQDLDKTDKENVARKFESEVESKYESKEERSQLPQNDDAENIIDNNGKNKLNRQDSFEDDDEDRRTNKDLDKIEY